MNHRVDIQALRGIAVLAVVFYHAKLLPLQGGFLGVDIFFVISGFLITGQIANQINRGTFSFRSFYLRRAWRLLPAAYFVFAVCLFVAPWILTEFEFADLRVQLFGALTFTANIVLWSQTGYFETAAELKPLLHAWSLSIEEQYYLVAPAILFFVSKKKWLITIALITATSFIVMSSLAIETPGAAFYLTPARIWELGIGSLLVLYISRYELTLPAWIGYSSLLILLMLLVRLVPSGEHIEVNLLVITVATAVIIAAKLPWLNNGLIASGLAAIGTISYSLYLVHWPVLAFLNSINIGGGGLWWPYRLSAVIFSLIAAWALYVLVESRFRITKQDATKTFRPLIFLSLLLALATYFYAPQQSTINYKRPQHNSAQSN